MPSLPLITIICSCYNHENFILQTLDSVMSQTYKNIEVIVVDDFSSDNSVELINSWLINHPSVKFVKNSSNLGITKSFNNAMKLAKGAYYMDLAGDDLLFPNCIQKLLNVFLRKSSNNLAVVFGNVNEIDENGAFLNVFFDKERIKRIFEAIATGYFKSLLSSSDYICSVSAMYKRECFTAVEGYDEDLFFEDLDFWLRLTYMFEIQFLDEVLVEKRSVNGSLGDGFLKKNRNTQALFFSMYLVLLKAYNMNLNSSEYHSLLKRIPNQLRWSIRTLNLKYIYLYLILYLKTWFKILNA